MDISYGSFTGLLALNFALIDIGLKIIALIIIPNNRKPSSATAWLLAIFFIPLIGLPLFFLLGNSVLSKPRTKQQNEITKHFQGIFNDMNDNYMSLPDESFASSAKLNYNLTKLPVVTATSYELIDQYDKFFKKLIEEVKKAKTSIWLEFYIMSYDKATAELLGELALARDRGVEVRVIYDHLGSLMYPGYKELKDFFKKRQINAHPSLPIKPFSSRYFQRPDLRNHRKIAVIDSKIGFMGSQNIIDKTYDKRKNIRRGLSWKELMVKLEGPIVRQLELVFANDWYAETGENLVKNLKPLKARSSSKKLLCQLLPSGPGYETENNLKAFNNLLYNARHKAVITSPYFVPDESMLAAITTAAERGVEVTLFVSEIGDQFFVHHAQRSYYERLMKSGINIYMYKSPTVLHSKHLTIDDDIAVIGSSNMDIRSLELNQEVSLLIKSKKFVKDMRQVEAAYFRRSKRLKLDKWLKRPYGQKIVDNLARLTSGLQ
jgi:cardiolipin synthase